MKKRGEEEEAEVFSLYLCACMKRMIEGRAGYIMMERMRVQ